MVKRGKDEKETLLLPLRAQGGGMDGGAVLLILSAPMKISDELNEILDEMLIPLSVAIERENIYRMLEGERNVIYNRSIRDTLTGLYNRQYMDDAVNRLIESHNRNYTDGLALIIVDVDKFKDVNDTYGHGVGDDVLKTIADTLREKLRMVDIPVRYGGDEFCFFILSRTLNESILVADRMRDTVHGLDFHKGEQCFKVSISVGVALHRQHESLDDLIRRADRGLYEVKRSGRDSVGSATEMNT
jgi:diguanylate cyclase (GGDEF)-like protein